MKKVILCLFLSFPSIVFAQQKLKYDIIKESGDTVFYTSEEKIYVSAGDTRGYGRNKQTIIGDYLKSTVLKYPNGFALEFAIQTGSTNSFSIYRSHRALLIMKDGSTLSLNSRNDYYSKKSSMGYGCWAFAFYTIPASSRDAIRNGIVSSVRIENSTGSFDYPLKEKHGQIIADQLKSF